MDEVEFLIEQLKSEDVKTRENAAKRLYDIKDKKAVPALCKALKDRDADVRFCAGMALGNIGDASAVPALIGALKDEDWYVRDRAARVLGKIVAECETMEALENVEKQTEKYSDALRKKHVDKRMLANDFIAVAKTLRIIAEKKDELASKKDLLLDDKPKPPKKGRGIYQASRRVRNG